MVPRGPEPRLPGPEDVCWAAGSAVERRCVSAQPVGALPAGHTPRARAGRRDRPPCRPRSRPGHFPAPGAPRPPASPLCCRPPASPSSEEPTTAHRTRTLPARLQDAPGTAPKCPGPRPGPHPHPGVTYQTAPSSSCKQTEGQPSDGPLRTRVSKGRMAVTRSRGPKLSP